MCCPTPTTNVFNISKCGPITKASASKRSAMYVLILDKSLIPLFTPLIELAKKMQVITNMTKNQVVLLFGTPIRNDRPPHICETPSPSEVATPAKDTTTEAL